MQNIIVQISNQNKETVHQPTFACVPNPQIVFQLTALVVIIRCKLS